jgi:hypothetical protein
MSKNKNFFEIPTVPENDYSNYVSKNSRFQNIKYTTRKGIPYVTRHGIRYHLDLFEVRLGDLKAYHFLTYSSCITLEINDDCDMAKVGYEHTSVSSKFLESCRY